MDVCVCLSGADGRVVEGRATLFRHHREVSRVQIPWMFVLYFMLCCPEREGGRGWPGKVPRTPPHIKKGKERADRKIPDRPDSTVKRERLKKYIY
jgi:uncharacterized protein YbbK (DUF523 family)